MPRSFSEREKEHINKRLKDSCKESWVQYGYKKTSVDELCRDFTILMNKLSEEQVKKMEESNNRNRQLFSGQPYLKLKVDEDMAMAVIYSLIMGIRNKDILPYSHVATFDFMVEQLVDSLYE